MMEITRESIVAAAARISGLVRRTPVLWLESEAMAIEGRLTLKLENLQVTGTFKARGAFNLLAGGGIDRVVAASGGNFGLAIGHAARVLHIPADLFVPDSSPPEKIALVRRTGAEVHVIPGLYADALAVSKEFASKVGATLAHAYDQREIVAGAGTCGIEIAVQVPSVDTVLVAVGGGGLIAGIASWFRNRARVVGVETEQTPTLYSARAAGKPVDVEVGGLAVSALGARRFGDIPWHAAARWVEDSILVSDDDLRRAQAMLWKTARLAIEPAAAAPLAALGSWAYRPAPNEIVVALICGANTDPGSVVSEQEPFAR
jgi:threonine dehydratase